MQQQPQVLSCCMLQSLRSQAPLRRLLPQTLGRQQRNVQHNREKRTAFRVIQQRLTCST
jgi:hypothetical protein